MSRRPLTRRNGFTLIELVTSMTIGAILLSGMGSAILIASHALPGRNTATGAILRASDVVEQIAGELHCAVTFTQRSATMVEITVPDRNADLTPETIRYTWSGMPGDPLTRQYNAGTIVNVAEDVQEFDLSYATRASPSLPDIEMPEELFLAQDANNSGTESEFALTATKKCAEKFKALLPADAVSWRITRIRFIASPSAGIQGNLSVEVMNTITGTGKPGSTEDAVLVPESNLIANNWYDVQFTNAGGLSPSDAYFIVFGKASGGGTVGLIKIGRGSFNSPQTTYWTGGNWQEDSTTDLWLWVWGKVTVPDPNPLPPFALVSVGIKLRLGMEARTRVQTAAQLLNTPKVTGP
ncbi:MAG: prepilin-type N-terminal cleavage/methylation domain-containing protein [Planctomycetota bacterium]|nr:prepilin-type N-terminal cleavage/methylation domain-containing protein [Planctomycetota bacterium]